MPRFTVKDMLVSTALVAVGLVVYLPHWHYAVIRDLRGAPPIGSPMICLLLWIASGACIGAGLLYPFKHWWAVGLIIGGIVQLVSLVPMLAGKLVI